MKNRKRRYVVLAVLCAMGFVTAAAEEQQASPALVAPMVPPDQFSIVLQEVNEPVEVMDLGLVEAGFLAGTSFRKSDELRIMAVNANPEASPKARIWLREADGETHFWYRTGGEGLADAHLVEPGEKVIVRKRKLSGFELPTR